MVHRSSVADNPVVRTSVITLSLVFIILAGLAAACAVFRKQNRRSSNTGECGPICHVL